jgi:ABC-2 type transport system permease protein
MTGFDARRVRAVVRKELRDYRRNRSIVVAMIILPAVFMIQPTLAVFLGSPDPSNPTYYALPLLLLLLVPVIMPSTLAAYSVVGEREQGTLEPLLTTPIRRQDFILGKAAAVMIPTLVLSYSVFGLFLAVVRLFAKPAVASGVFHQGPVLLALLLFTPLLAGWAVVVGMAISVRAREVRVAQQLATLASFPPLGAVVVMGTGVIHPTFTVAVLFAVGLLVIDARAVRVVSRMFNRERLVTGAKAAKRVMAD